MQFSEKLSFDGTPEDVFTMMTDEAWLAKVAERLGARLISASSDNGRIVSHLEFDTPDSIPTQVRRFFGDTTGMQMVSTWRSANDVGERTGTFQVTVDGFSAASASGQTALRKTATGSQVTYDGDFTIAIPIIGKRLEAGAARYLIDAIRAQEQVGRDWLTAS